MEIKLNKQTEELPPKATEGQQSVEHFLELISYNQSLYGKSAFKNHF